MTSAGTNWVFDFLALVFFVVLFRTLWSAKNDPKLATAGNAAVAAIVAAFCALMGNPDQFQKISFSPTSGIAVEARQTIQQAQATLAQLQKLGSLMGQFMIEEDAARGRLGVSSSREEHEALRKSIIDLLKSVNLPDNELSKVATADRKWVIFDYVFGSLHSGNSRVPGNKREEWSKIYNEYTQGGSIDKYAELTPNKLEELLKGFDILDDHEKSIIEDYRYYLKTGIPRHT